MVGSNRVQLGMQLQVTAVASALVVLAFLVQHRAASAESWCPVGHDFTGVHNQDEMGYAVAIAGGDDAVVALGSPGSRSGYATASVSVYEVDNTFSSWDRLGSKLSGGTQVGDEFGRAVSLSADGTVLAVGSPGSSGTEGRVQVYERSAGRSAWSLAYSAAGVLNGDLFGHSVSLSPSGNRLAVGAPLGYDAAGYVEVFAKIGGRWAALGDPIIGVTDGDRTGFAVAISNNSVLIVGSPRANNGDGVVEAFKYSSSGRTWDPLGDTIVGHSRSRLGAYVSVSDAGLSFAVGAPYDNSYRAHAGLVQVYEWKGNRWESRGAAILGDAANVFAGNSVSISSNGSRVAVGAPGPEQGTVRGYVSVFEWTGYKWALNKTISGSTGEEFGFSVGLSADGETLAVGSPSTHSMRGRVSVFRQECIGEDSDLSVTDVIIIISVSVAAVVIVVCVLLVICCRKRRRARYGSLSEAPEHGAEVSPSRGWGSSGWRRPRRSNAHGREQHTTDSNNGGRSQYSRLSGNDDPPAHRQTAHRHAKPSHSRDRPQSSRRMDL